MDWNAAGAIIAAIALAAGGVGALFRRRSARRAQEPRIIFGDLYFAGPEEPVRPAYRFAIGVHLTNVGGGPALHLHWGFADPDGSLYAEMVHRAALLPDASTDDWAGIRGQEQGDDPSEDEARAFYDRCLVFAECWDSRGDHYVFFPFGGGRAPEIHGDADQLRAHLSQFPSRGELPRSRGAGRFDK